MLVLRSKLQAIECSYRGREASFPEISWISHVHVGDCAAEHTADNCGGLVIADLLLFWCVRLRLCRECGDWWEVGLLFAVFG